MALLVVANHTPGLRELFPHLEVGKTAVCAFFFISGFLMPLTFDSHYRGYGALRGSAKFYVNRFLRIYPIYWVSLGITLLCVLAYTPLLLEHAATSAALHEPGTYLPNVLLLTLNQTRLWGGDFRFNPPAWTLDVELQYYLLVPFLLLAMPVHRRTLKAALILLSVASLYFFFRPPQLLDFERSLIPWMCFFLLGYGFYLLPQAQALALRRRLLLCGTIGSLALAALSRSSSLAVLLVILAFILVSAHLLVLQQDRRFGSLDKLLGDLSYPTYILHWICIQLVARWLGPHLIGLSSGARFSSQLALNIPFAIISAYAALRLVGDPIEALRRRIRRPVAAPE